MVQPCSLPQPPEKATGAQFARCSTCPDSCTSRACPGAARGNTPALAGLHPSAGAKSSARSVRQVAPSRPACNSTAGTRTVRGWERPGACLDTAFHSSHAAQGSAYSASAGADAPPQECLLLARPSALEQRCIRPPPAPACRRPQRGLLMHLRRRPHAVQLFIFLKRRQRRPRLLLFFLLLLLFFFQSVRGVLLFLLRFHRLAVGRRGGGGEACSTRQGGLRRHPPLAAAGPSCNAPNLAFSLSSMLNLHVRRHRSGV